MIHPDLVTMISEALQHSGRTDLVRALRSAVESARSAQALADQRAIQLAEGAALIEEMRRRWPRLLLTVEVASTERPGTVIARTFAPNDLIVAHGLLAIATAHLQRAVAELPPTPPNELTRF